MSAQRIAALALWAALLYCVAPAMADATAGPLRAQQPEPGWAPAQCEKLGAFAGVVADFRDSGANLQLHLATFRRRHQALGPALKRVLEREIARVYAEGLPAEKAELSAYTRCMSNEINAKEG